MISLLNISENHDSRARVIKFTQIIFTIDSPNAGIFHWDILITHRLYISSYFIIIFP